MADQSVATVTGRFIGGGLFEARTSGNSSTPKFSACVVLDKGQDAKIEKLVSEAIAEEFGNRKPSGLQNWALRIGDEEEFEHSFNKKYINPKSNREPQRLVKREGVFERVTKEDDIIYPGCHVAVSVSAYAYPADKEKGIKPGVTLNLRGVMFTKNGERIDDIVNPENEFGDYSSEETAEDDDFLAAG